MEFLAHVPLAHGKIQSFPRNYMKLHHEGQPTIISFDLTGDCTIALFFLALPTSIE